MKKEKRDLTYDLDFSAKEIWQVFELAKKLKRELKKGKSHEYLKGKSLAMIFQKPSTRTRVSFEVAMTQLGGHALYLSPNDLQLSRGETLADTARTISRYCDAIMARVFSHQDIIAMSKNATVPVINGLSDKFHPCQGLTDIFTIWEKLNSSTSLTTSFPDDFTIVFVGDGDNNVTNSLLLLCARLGINFRVACPKEYQTKKEVLDLAKEDILKTRAKIEIINNPQKAVENANVIYTDVWVSMGREAAEERRRILSPYQVNQELLSWAQVVPEKVRSRPDQRRDAAPLSAADPLFSIEKRGTMLSRLREAFFRHIPSPPKREKLQKSHSLILPMVMHCLPAHRGEEITDDVMDGPNSIVFDQVENRLHVQKAILYFLLK